MSHTNMVAFAILVASFLAVTLIAHKMAAAAAGTGQATARRPARPRRTDDGLRSGGRAGRWLRAARDQTAAGCRYGPAHASGQ
jgi:hypothetical protein